MIRTAKSIADVQEAVASARDNSLVLRGGGTKPVLSGARPGCMVLDLSALTGLLEYEPSEFTFTALAGTPLRQIASALAANGQYMPFDPPFAEEGATIGGTLAAGLSGARRLRYGGIRDFVIGIKYVDSDGSIVCGGGKVVKNAAGYDTPKLFAGSLGGFGAIVDVSFKVFPAPASLLHLVYETGSLEAGLALLEKLSLSVLEPEALDLEPGGRVHLSLAGSPDAVGATRARVDAQGSVSDCPFDPIASDRPLLAKLPLTVDAIPEVDAFLEQQGIRRNYSVAGNVAWLGLSCGDLAELDDFLRGRGLRALLLRGEAEGGAYLGQPLPDLAHRLKKALDPHEVFASSGMIRSVRA